MTEFISRNYGNEGYEIIIKTDSHEHYRATEDFARRLIDHTKPVTNTQKIRAMSDEELAKYLYQMQKNILRHVATVIGYSEEFDFADEAPDLLEWLQQPCEGGEQIMVWKSVHGFEGKYQISYDGTVRSMERVVKNKDGTMTVNERVLKPWVDTWGYKRVCLYKNGKPHQKFVHRLIAEAFIPPFTGQQVNHIDGDKLNNSVENLEWCTGSENMQHAYRNGLHSGTTPVILVELGIRFNSIEEAARFVEGKHSGIRRCLTGRNKTHRGFHFVRAEEGE